MGGGGRNTLTFLPAGLPVSPVLWNSIAEPAQADFNQEANTVHPALTGPLSLYCGGWKEQRMRRRARPRSDVIARMKTLSVLD